MIETKVPKDIRVYETKIVGPFTLRQAVCFILLVLIDILVFSYVITPFKISLDNSIYLLCLIDIPISAFGFLKVMGVPLEKYLKSVFVGSVLSPAHRKMVRKKKIEHVRKKQKKLPGKILKAHPEYKAYK